MKKVLILSPSVPSYKGGVAVFVKNIAQNLSSDFNVEVLFPSNKNEDIVKEKVLFLGRKTTSLPFFNFIQFIIKTYFWIKKRKYDLIIDNSGYTTLLPSSEKVLYIVHGSHKENLRSRKIKDFYSFFGYISMRLLTQYQKISIKKAFRVVSISPKVTDEIIENYNVDKKKIVEISNGTYFNLTDNEFETIFKNRKGNKVCFISSDHIWKGISIVEYIADKNPDILFYVCGYKYENKQHTNIIYKGLLNEAELKDVMLESDIFLFPSKYEGQSLAILDAMACGLPIITYKRAEPGFGDGIGYIGDSLNPEDFNSAFNNLINDKNMRYKIGLSNIFLANKITREKQGLKYKNYINSIL